MDDIEHASRLMMHIDLDPKNHGHAPMSSSVFPSDVDVERERKKGYDVMHLRCKHLRRQQIYVEDGARASLALFVSFLRTLSGRPS